MCCTRAFQMCKRERCTCRQKIAEWGRNHGECLGLARETARGLEKALHLDAPQGEGLVGALVSVRFMYIVIIKSMHGRQPYSSDCSGMPDVAPLEKNTYGTPSHCNPRPSPHSASHAPDYAESLQTRRSPPPPLCAAPGARALAQRCAEASVPGLPAQRSMESVLTL